MRNVMVGCILSVLLCGLSQLVPLLAQNHGYNLWSEPQITSDEWHPFVPPNYEQHDRPIPSFPRTDSVRQYFGKTPLEPVQNSALKKSFQASATANNIDQYSIPSISGEFGSFAVQQHQSRNPVFDKNIKDSHLLEQPSHFRVMYQIPQQQPQVSTSLHRFPAYLTSETIEQYQRQPLPPQQPQSSFRANSPHSYLTRSSSILQPAAQRNPITTSVQVFPPPPPPSKLHNQQFTNSYYIGVSHRDEYSEEDSPHDRKNMRNNVNIYNTREGAFSLPLVPPVTQKTNPYGHRSENNFYFDYEKTLPKHFEYVATDLHRGVPEQPRPSYHSVYNNEHIRGTNGGSGLNLKKLNLDGHKKAENTSYSKQVYVQLSHLERPFTLPKHSEPESLSSYSSVPRQSQPPPTYKKTKLKQPAISSTVFYGQSDSPPSPIDYDVGDLQSVKSVTYQPEQDFMQFNEGDVSNVNAFQPTSEKFASKSFLPTAIETNEDVDLPNGATTFAYHSQHAIKPTELTYISKLPYNHKYTSSRNQHPESEPHSFSYEYKLHSDFTETESTDGIATTASTTKKPSVRRRKPTKTKSKIPAGRYKSTTEQDVDYSSTVAYENDITPGFHYYKTEMSHFGKNGYSNEHQLQDTSAVTDTQPPTTASSSFVSKRKQKFKSTTTAVTSSDDDYPNYPIEYNYQNKRYPSGETQYNQETEQNTELEDTIEIGKANYPSVRQKLKSSSTETTAPLSLSFSTPKIQKSKFTTPATTVSSNFSNAVTRPRFSIKDYRRTTTSIKTTQQQTTPFADTTKDAIAEAEMKKNRKQLFAVRSRNKTEQTITDSDSPVIDNNDKKYKPRIRPSKLKISALTPITTPVVVDTTSEQVITFKPSNRGRLKTSTSKYYHQFRTTTELESNAALAESESDERLDDDIATAYSNNKPTRIALYSAKKSSIGNLPTKDIIKVKISEYVDDEQVDYNGDNNEDVLKYTDEDEKTSKIEPQIKSEKNKKVTYKPLNNPSKIDKSDDDSKTRIMTSSEEEIIRGDNNSSDMEQIEGDNFSAYSVAELPNEDGDTSVVEEPKNNSTNSLQSVLLTSTLTVKPQTGSSSITTTLIPVTVSSLIGDKVDTFFEDHTQNRKDQLDYQDDVNDRVSKISSLTSQDELNHVNGAIHHKQWRFPLYSPSRFVTAIKTTMDY